MTHDIWMILPPANQIRQELDLRTDCYFCCTLNIARPASRATSWLRSPLAFLSAGSAGAAAAPNAPSAVAASRRTSGLSSIKAGRQCRHGLLRRTAD